jgi:hypothetical protein
MAQTQPAAMRAPAQKAPIAAWIFAAVLVLVGGTLAAVAIATRSHEAPAQPKPVATARAK